MTEDEKEEQVGKRVRSTSRIVAVVFALWFIAQWMQTPLQIPNEVMIVLDFIALCTFIWVMFSIWMIIRIIRSE